MTPKLILEFVGDLYMYVPYTLLMTLYASQLLRRWVTIDSIYFPKPYWIRILIAVVVLALPQYPSWKVYYGNFHVETPVEKTTDARDSVKEILKK